MNKSLRLFVLFSLLAMLTATTALAQLRVSKTGIQFGNLVVTNTKVDSFYVANDSTVAFTIASSANDVAVFSVAPKSKTFPVTVNAKDSVWFYVNFKPTDVAPYTDLIRLSHNAPRNNPLRITLGGTGLAQLLLSKASLAFGSLAALASKTDSFSIKNQGTVAVAIDSLTRSAPTGFAVVSRSGSLTPTINPNDIVWFVVTFTPTALQSYSDNLKFYHRSPGTSPLTVALSGQGDVHLVLSKTSISFGSVGVQATKVDSFSVTNRAISAVNITSLTNNLPARFAVVPKTNDTLRAIQPGEVVWYYVRFTPDTIKSYADTAKLGHDAAFGSSPLKVTLSGSGIAQVALTKSTIAFGTVAVTATKKDTFFVKNISTTPQNVLGVTNAKTQYVVTALGGNLTPTINGGDSAGYAVAFTPTAASSYPDTIKITHNALGTNPLKVVLSGTGGIQLKSSQTTMSFGTIDVLASRADSFYVTNISAVALTLTSVTKLTTKFAILSGSLSGTINPGDTLWYRISFTPDSVGPFRDTLSFAHSGVSSPLKVALTGSGLNLVRPYSKTGSQLSSFVFADGFAGVPRLDTIYIKNAGTADANLTQVLNVNPKFSLILPSLPVVVHANLADSILVAIQYSPTTVAREYDTVKIYPSGGLNSTPFSLPVRARALGSFAFSTTTIGTPLDTSNIVRVSGASSGTTPGSVLPPVAVDSTRSLTVYMRNRGSQTYRVDSVKFQTPHFFSTVPTPFTIKPGDNDVYQILLQFRFRPKSVGNPLRDTITFFTNDTVAGGNRIQLVVEGASQNMNYVLTTRSRKDMYFAAIPVGSVSADSAVRIYNYKTSALNIDSVKLAQNNPRFIVDTVNAGYKRLPAQGDTSIVIVRYAPADTLPNLATVQRDTLLIYYHNGVGLGTAPFKLPLAGTTAVGVVFAPAGNISYGEIPVSAIKDTILRVFNRTKKAYRIDSLILFKATHYTILSNALQTKLNPNDTAVIQLRFQPLTGGPLVDTLYIWHNFTTDLVSTNPRKVVLSGVGGTQGVIQAANYVTVDNIEGQEGVAIMSSDSTYKERGNFWNNTGSSYGTGHRRSPNLSGSNNGSAATYTFKIDSTGPYLMYHYLLNSPNVGGNFYVWLEKFGIGGVFDSVRYNGFDNRTLVAGYGGTWKPIMMHWIDGVGPGAARVTMGADERSGGFLRVDAFRMVRSRQKRDIEFGRRDFSFTSNRVPEEFPEVTLGDVLDRPYRIYNLGTDTLTISDIKFFPTTGMTSPRFSIKNPVFPMKVPPMGGTPVKMMDSSVTPPIERLVDPGGSLDLKLVFTPFQEEIVRDSMVITSNDDTEPYASIVLNGRGINYNFIMNASLGGTEPHFRAPTPEHDNISTVPRYYEGQYGSWANSTLAGVTYPIAGGNYYSRVNVGSTPTATTPHQCFYEFELPDVAFGKIPTDGRYILEYGGPAGSPNGYSRTEVIVAQSFGLPPDSGYFSGTTDGAHQWLQIGGTLKTFIMTPGGKISATYQRTSKTDADGGVGVLRSDLLRIRKVPTGALVGVSKAAPDSIHFGDINFRNPGGITGTENRQALIIGSTGESALTIKNIRLRSGTDKYFKILNPPAPNTLLPAISGKYTLNLQFTPDKIAPRFRDTLEISSNTSRIEDTLLLVPVSGVGIGGIFWVDNDDFGTFQVYSNHTISGSYIGTWDRNRLESWQRQYATTENTIGYKTTILKMAIPIAANHGGFFEWYPEIPTMQGASDSVYVNVSIALGAGATKVSPAAQYKIYTLGIVSLDTTVGQNNLTAGRFGVAEINLGNHWFQRGGKDAPNTNLFGHVRVINDTDKVAAYYGSGTNLARRDTFALVADAIIVRELADPRAITVGVDSKDKLPREYALSQNYPNPFNPTTTIRFALPERANVELKVYDLLGREVRTLLSGNTMVAGNHSVVWDGRNEARQPVATGVYFYRLHAGPFSQVKKMLLLK